MRLIVTGAAGFIGSAFCRYVLDRGLADVVAVDRLTYAAAPTTVTELRGYGRLELRQQDIADVAAMREMVQSVQPDAIVHLAAETHVDRSIDSAQNFLHSNINGTFSLLEASRSYLLTLPAARRERFRFHHVSTDEVYGALGQQGAFDENTPYAPNSPYAASKAAADHLVRAWQQTYGLPALISNCSNNYGPYQFPEKMIPTMILKALEGAAMPVYGRGENVRDWLFVQDHAAALWLILNRGQIGAKYNVGGGCELRNIDLVHRICAIMDRLCPRKNGAHETLIRFVPDRPGHDFRYAIDDRKIRNDLGWRPETSIEEGLETTVAWYLARCDWWQTIPSGHYDGARLGLGTGERG